MLACSSVVGNIWHFLQSLHLPKTQSLQVLFLGLKLVQGGNTPISLNDCCSMLCICILGP